MDHPIYTSSRISKSTSPPKIQFRSLSQNRLSKNNDWNSDLEKLAKQWGEESMALGWMHLKTSQFKNKRFVGMSMSATLMATVSGFGGILNTHCESIWDLIWKLFALGAAIPSAAIPLLKDSENANKHKEAAYKFQALSNDITYQLALPRSKRIPGTAYIRDTKEIFDTLQLEAPQPDSQFINKFNRKFRNKNFAKPDVAGGISEIDIHVKGSSDSSSPERSQTKQLSSSELVIQSDPETNTSTVVFPDNNSKSLNKNKLRLSVHTMNKSEKDLVKEFEIGNGSVTQRIENHSNKKKKSKSKSKK